MCFFFNLQYVNMHGCCSECKAKIYNWFWISLLKKTQTDKQKNHNSTLKLSWVFFFFLQSSWAAMLLVMGNFFSSLRWGWECVRSLHVTFSWSRLAVIGREPKPSSPQIHSSPSLLQSAEASCVLAPSIICVAFMLQVFWSSFLVASCSRRIQNDFCICRCVAATSHVHVWGQVWIYAWIQKKVCMCNFAFFSWDINMCRLRKASFLPEENSLYGLTYGQIWL